MTRRIAMDPDYTQVATFDSIQFRPAASRSLGSSAGRPLGAGSNAGRLLLAGGCTVSA